MSTISIFPSAKNTKGGSDIPLDIFLSQIQSGKYEDVIHQLRRDLADVTEKSKRQALKVAALGGVTLSGRFESRNNAGILEHSGYIGIDIDGVNPETVKTKLRRDKYLYAAFTSCSGTGCCLIFKINPEKHLEAFYGLESYLWSTYRLIADQACKDVSRFRFWSWDPNIFFNYQHIEFKSYLKKKKAEKPVKQVVFIRSELDYIIDQITFDLVPTYEEWRNVGFAICAQFKESGREIFHTISRHGDYSAEECDKQYENCLNADEGEKDKKISIAYFFDLCKKKGIVTVSQQVHNISKHAATNKKANSSIEQTINHIQKFVEKDADPELIRDIVSQVFNNNIEIPDVSEIEAGRLWIKNQNLRRNLITGYIEVNGVPIEDSQSNSLELRMKEDLKTPYDDSKRLLNSDAVPVYHEIFEFFDKHKARTPDGVIDELAACIKSPTGGDTDYVALMLKKWLVGAVANLYDHPKFGYSPLMLVLCGSEQGKGKSSFFTKLLPFDKYVAMKDFSGMGKESFKRDMEIAITTNWLVWDDELGNKSKRDHRIIKAMLSTVSTTARAAYGRNDKTRKRIAFFGGTSNDLNIVPEHGEQRRIIPIEVESMDFERKDAIDLIDLWMEAYHLYQDSFNYTILGDEIKMLSQHTEQYKETSTLEMLLSTKFEPEPNITVENAKNYIGLTVPTIFDRVRTLWPNERITETSLGIALKGIGCVQHTKRSRETQKHERQYFVREKANSISSLIALGKILAATGGTDPAPF
jgi:predicted P-loop ATPase